MLCASPALASWADFWHFPFVLSHKQLGKILHAIRHSVDSVGESLPWFAIYFWYTGFLFLAEQRWFIWKVLCRLTVSKQAHPRLGEHLKLAHAGFWGPELKRKVNSLFVLCLFCVGMPCWTWLSIRSKIPLENSCKSMQTLQNTEEGGKEVPLTSPLQGGEPPCLLQLPNSTATTSTRKLLWQKAWGSHSAALHRFTMSSAPCLFDTPFSTGDGEEWRVRILN
jgi:hypothetical protein